jgi:hypothetical protein
MPTLDEFQNAQERYGKLGYRLIKRYGKRGARVKYQYATLNMVRRKNILRGVSYSLSHMTLPQHKGCVRYSLGGTGRELLAMGG